MTEKELILATQFDKAPENVKLSVLFLRDLRIKYNKAIKQSNIIAQEMAKLKSEISIASQQFESVMEKWVPEETKEVTR
jgi:hypothetical protein